jgi:ferredoxin--NADP+ reductase
VDSIWKLNVDGNHFRNIEGFIEDNLYVVGWAKRGPTGVIGTNKSDATLVVGKVVKQLGNKVPKNEMNLTELLGSVNYLNLNQWRILNEYELDLGAKSGRPRVKLTQASKMIEVIEEESSR